MMLMSILNSGTGLAALVALLPLLANTVQAAQPYCPMKFKHRLQPSETHSACLKPSSQATNIGVSDADKLAIVKHHNDGRSKVDPPADNMLKMYWDDEVAQVAQGWAQNCDYRHDEKIRRNIPGRFGLGQNIGEGYEDWSTMFDSWYDEYKVFTYGTASTTRSVIGHYTQIVWAESFALGCGFAVCNGRTRYVCNYGPAGNVASKLKPYKTGSTIAATCPTYTEGNLCDCGSHTCSNGGRMNMQTCTCECKPETVKFIKGEYCSLNCTLAEQNILDYCGDVRYGYVESKCDNVLNVPYECPIMCKVCPYGDEVFSQDNGQASACETGSSLPGVFCGRGPGRQDCPEKHHCVIDPLDRWAVCCPGQDGDEVVTQDNGQTNACGSGSPLPDVFCGRGPERKDCPDSHQCVIDLLGRWAVCCPIVTDATENILDPGGEVGSATNVVCWLALVQMMALLATSYSMTQSDVV